MALFYWFPEANVKGSSINDRTFPVSCTDKAVCFTCELTVDVQHRSSTNSMLSGKMYS